MSRTNPVGMNPDGSTELFLHDLKTGTIVQATSTTSGVATKSAQITADGSRILFTSAYDFLTGTFSAPIRLWEFTRSTGALRELPGAIQGVFINLWRASGNGDFVVFLSTADLVGQNSDGSLEIYRTAVLTGATQQLSTGGAGLQPSTPDINFDGSVVVWSDRRNFDGSNGNRNPECWMWRQATGLVESVTAQSSHPTRGTAWNRIDDAGRYVAFASNFNYSGGSSSGARAYIADTVTGAVVDGGPLGLSPQNVAPAEGALSPDGSVLYYERNDRRELFRYSRVDDRLDPIPMTTAFNVVPDEVLGGAVDVAGNNAIVYRSTNELDPNSSSFARMNVFRGVPLGQVGRTYCLATSNSTQRGARIRAEGIASSALQRLSIITTSVPAGTPAVVLYSGGSGSTPLGSGNLCLGPGFTRLPLIYVAPASGVVESELDFASFGAGWTAGSTWYFQLLFRDQEQGVATVNLSNGLIITFGP